MERVALGEVLEIRNQKKVVAVLHPPPPASSLPVPLRFPDYANRLKKTFGDKLLEPDATRLITEDRGDR